ncbi:MAG TPA: extracellular solute-binding protein, partial [Sphaerochaeta sp.]|nr:extracellular solute-binding protein [Sphaerochaeta sp.]
MKKLSKGMLVVLVLLLAMQGVWAQGAKEAAVQDKTIRIFGAFRGEEAARFDEIVRIFNEKTGYNAVYEGSPEFETQILVQAEAGTPPDIAALPQPGIMHKFAEKGYIKPLTPSVVSMI